MEIILGKNAGFCYGVRKAVDGANEELKKVKKEMYCLGEIVHNKQVVNDLKNKGLKIVEEIHEVKENAIIRAHGVKKEVYEFAKENNIHLKDFTCPNVLKIHKIANQYAKKGYYIFLCGSKIHPENIGTLSYCGKNVSVIEKEEDTLKAINQFEKSKIKNLLVIIQTTYSINKFSEIEKILKENISKETNLEIRNTICGATKLRQDETNRVSKEVDYMIIIGGANSSNTKKLYEISKENCKNSISIETVEELPIKEIKNYNKIGIMAGASTPQEEIEKVVKKLEELKKNRI